LFDSSGFARLLLLLLLRLFGRRRRPLLFQVIDLGLLPLISGTVSRYVCLSAARFASSSWICLSESGQLLVCTAPGLAQFLRRCWSCRSTCPDCSGEYSPSCAFHLQAVHFVVGRAHPALKRSQLVRVVHGIVGKRPEFARGTWRYSVWIASSLSLASSPDR